ncbi:MAG TPA: GNAT family N-acetyltransferase [Puia sp.]|nr:GNAT family N-acetyltransferase [Puia sp.]
MTQIIEYEDKYKEDFRKLNFEWLDKYQLLESHDQLVLNDPQGTIIDRGGFIYLARIGEEIVGTAGLAKEQEGEYELIKMAVARPFRGRGISKLLIEKCLEKAKEIGAQKILLYSNSQLQTAISLYSKYGFRHVPVIDAPFVTADVKMELEL